MTKQNEIINDKNYIAVLDHGFVGLVDSMGNDSSIVQAARVSYGAGTKKASDDKNLIRYLMKHYHSTPFEMVEMKFHMKLPIFVARQLIRHRTASVNEYSGRYSLMTDEFYVPKEENLKPQSQTNKQGREGELSSIEKEIYKNTIDRTSKEAYADYMVMIGEGKHNYNIENQQGLARELARIVLPVSNYTEWYWKIDLHNLFHFLKLRLDSHAQWEIRQFAQAIYTLTKNIVPIACEAFENYILNAKTFSAQELQILKSLIRPAELAYQANKLNTLSAREYDDLLKKLNIIEEIA